MNWRSWVWRWGIPIGAWLLSSLFYMAAARAANVPPLSPNTWARWDSYQYLSIAAQSYRIWQEPRVAQNRRLDWNGNTGWFPLYPYGIRLIHRAGPGFETAGRLLSEAAWMLTLWLLWNGFLAPRRQGMSLALAAVFPGGIYYHALFPVSLFLGGVLLYFHCLVAGRWRTAFALGVLTGMTYTSAPYLLVVAAVWTAWEAPRIGARSHLAVAASAPPLGAVLVFLIQRLQTGAWDAFFRIWDFHRYNGWSLTRLQQMLYIPTIFQPTDGAKSLVIAQSISVAAAMALALWGYQRMASECSVQERAALRLLLVYAFVYWILPHAGVYRLSWYRAEALLLPIVVFLGGVPRWVQASLIAVWGGLAWGMALLFFRGILV